MRSAAGALNPGAAVTGTSRSLRRRDDGRVSPPWHDLRDGRHQLCRSRGRATRFHLLAPGTARRGGPGSRHSPGGFSFNGQRPRSNGYVIDGVSANVGIEPGEQVPGASVSGAAAGLTAGGGANGLASAAATQDSRCARATSSPEYGRTPGAQVSVTTRSGTNELHGSLFELLRRRGVRRQRLVRQQPRARAPSRRMADYGGTLGGPLKRDRLFFFGSYEGQRQRQPAFAFTEVPSLAARLAAPDLQPFLNAFPLPTGRRAPTASRSSPRVLDTRRARLLQLPHRPHGHEPVAQRALRLRRLGGRRARRGRRFAQHAEPHAQPRAGAHGRPLIHGFAGVILTVRANYSRVSARGSRLLDTFGGAVVPAGGHAGGRALNNTRRLLRLRPRRTRRGAHVGRGGHEPTTATQPRRLARPRLRHAHFQVRRGLQEALARRRRAHAAARCLLRGRRGPLSTPRRATASSRARGRCAPSSTTSRPTRRTGGGRLSA